MTGTLLRSDESSHRLAARLILFFPRTSGNSFNRDPLRMDLDFICDAVGHQKEFVFSATLSSLSCMAFGRIETK